MHVMIRSIIPQIGLHVWPADPAQILEVIAHKAAVHHPSMRGVVDIAPLPSVQLHSTWWVLYTAIEFSSMPAIPPGGPCCWTQTADSILALSISYQSGWYAELAFRQYLLYSSKSHNALGLYIACAMPLCAV